MTLTSLEMELAWPPYAPENGGAPNDAGLLASASGDYIAFICQIPKTGTLSKVGWASDTVSVSGDAITTIENVSIVGQPSGTLYHANATNTQAVSGNNSWQVNDFTDFSVTGGDIVALKVEWSSGNWRVKYWTRGADRRMPYILHDFSGVSNQAGTPLLYFEYDDGSIEVPLGCHAALNRTSRSFDNATNPNTVGNVVIPPWDCRVTGVWFHTDQDGDADYKLVTSAYNKGSATGILESISRDNAQRSSGAARMMAVYFDDTVDLTADTKYRVLLEPSSGTNCAVYMVDHSAEDHMNSGIWGHSDSVYATQADDPTGDGDWTDYDGTAGGSNEYKVAGFSELNDLSAAQVNAEVDTALSDYDAPTKAELDAGFSALNDLSAAQVNAEVDTALSDIHLDHLFATNYDPASKPGTSTALLNEIVENDGGVSRFTVNSLENAPSGSGASAEAIADAVWDEAQGDHTGAGTFGEMATEIASVLTDTGTTIPNQISGLNDLSAAQVNAEVDTALSDYDAPTKAELDAGFSALNDLSAAQVNAEVDTALSDYDAPTKAELDAVESKIDTLDSNVDTVNTNVDEIHKVHGLSSGNPMTVTSSSRSVGSISQTITGDGATTSTVTRD